MQNPVPLDPEEPRAFEPSRLALAPSFEKVRSSHSSGSSVPSSRGADLPMSGLSAQSLTAQSGSTSSDDDAPPDDAARHRDGWPQDALAERLDGLERALQAIHTELTRMQSRQVDADRASASDAAGGFSRTSNRSSSSAGSRSSLTRFRRRRSVHNRLHPERALRKVEESIAAPRRDAERPLRPRLSLASSTAHRDPEPEEADFGEPDEDVALDEPDASAGPRAKRFYLSLDDEVVRAPSIGPRTAERLAPAGVVLVRHLLACDPEYTAKQLNNRFLNAARIRDFQAQARLVCTIPWLRGTHAQLLVGAGYCSLAAIVSVDSEDVCSDVLRYAATREGQSVLRAGAPPSIERIMHWVRNASMAEPERAAA